jgi:hypothetical protein
MALENTAPIMGIQAAKAQVAGATLCVVSG